MLLDSGADMTCVPKSITAALNTHGFGSVDTVDFDGKLSTLRTCFLNVEYEGYNFGATEVIEINDDVGVIGRDLLNQHIIVLDGPGLAWEKR